MAGFFRKTRVNSEQSAATALRIQSALQGRAMPIGCGQFRLGGNVIAYAGFTATQAKQGSGSKGSSFFGGGGKGSTGQYNYSVSFTLSIGNIQVDAWIALYNGNAVNFYSNPPASVSTALAQLGITDWTVGNQYGQSFYNGTDLQGVDPFWQANYPATAFNYHGESYTIFPNLSLGSSPALPNYTLEVRANPCNDIPALGPDANPADWITSLLTDPAWGLPGFSSSLISAFSTYRTYCRATGMLISDVLVDQTPLNTYLDELMKATNSKFRWTSGVLSIIPLGDGVVTGNGYTYTPNLTPIYDIDATDLLVNQGSLGSSSSSSSPYVAFSRKDPSTVMNKVRIEYLDRNQLYNPVPIYENDDASILATRERISDLRSCHFFALGTAASMSATLQLQREQVVNSLQITVGRQFILLDPLDFITITEPALQLNRQLVRINEIQENLDGTLTFTCEEVPLTAAPALYARQGTLGAGRNNNTPAGDVNPPMFFEPPDQISGGLELDVAISGQLTDIWGGCLVWFSTDGNTYSIVGRQEGPTRMGVLTAPLGTIAASPSGTTIDSVNTLRVSLAESASSLSSGTPIDMTTAATACVVDQEIVAYQNATLTGANAYNLAPLLRGAYGSTIAAHQTGATFMRLDGSQFKENYPSSLVGTQGYFKFTSFNIFGAGLQQLSDVGAYPYKFTGAALSSPLPAITGLYTNFASGFQQIFWDEIHDFRTDIFYEIRQGDTWESALLLKTQAHPPFIAQGNGIFWVSAKCTPITGLTVYSAAPADIEITGNQLSANLIKSVNEQALGWPGHFDNGLGTTGIGAGKSVIIGGSGDILSDSPLLESLRASAPTAAGGNVLHFSSVPAGITNGMSVKDTDTANAIPDGVTVISTTPTTVTLSANVGGAGVLFNDTIVFSTADILDFGGIVTSTPLYYTAPTANVIDIGYLAQASINATLKISGAPVGQNILTNPDILGTPDILGSASTDFVNGWVEIRIAQGLTTDVFALPDVFDPADVFLAYAWGDWQKFIPGIFLGRAFQFRFALETLDPNTVAVAQQFNYQVQVPARIDHYQNQTVPPGGLTIVFQPDGAALASPFNAGPDVANLPYVNVSFSPTATGEYPQITGLSLSQMTITFYNASGVAITQGGVNIDVEGF